MINIEYFTNKKLCRIHGDHFDSIREHFSTKNVNAFFMKRHRGGFAPDRIYAITPTGLFEPGLFYSILRYVKSVYPNEEIVVHDTVKQVVSPNLNECEVYNNLQLPLRDYQLEIVQKSISRGRGIICLGTGGGKTLTIASLLSSIFLTKKDKFKCLLIVPDLSLVKQTYDDFINYKVPFKITKWTGSITPDLTSNVIIVNMGVLQSRFKEENWIADIDVLVIDECHKLKKGNKINKVISSIKTNNRFGLTGTLPDNKIDEWNIVGKIGDVSYTKNSYELRLENYLTNAEIKILNISYKDKVVQTSLVNDFRNELEFIYNNSFRNSIIKSISEKFNNNILIMVNHIAHGQALYDYFSKHLKDKSVYFIRGEVEVEDRAKVIREMESTNNVVCIAISAIFSTGINIKNLHMIVFASGGKSFIRVIQSIGRGLRLNANKDKLTIIDLADNLKYSLSHGVRRQEIYQQEKIQYKVVDIVEK